MSYALIATIGAFLVGFAACFRSIVDFFKNTANFFLGVTDLDGKTSSAIYFYLIKNFKLVQWRNKTIFSMNTTATNSKGYRMIGLEMLGYDTIFFRQGWFKWLCISPGHWYINKTTGEWERGIQLFAPRFMWDLNKLLSTCLDRFHGVQQLNNRFNVTRFCGKKNKTVDISDATKKPQDKPNSDGLLFLEVQNGRAIPINDDIGNIKMNFDRDPFDLFPYNKHIMEFVDEAKFWKESELWYKSKNIPWRLGWLLYGKPGTGKSFLLRNLAQKLNMPIFVLDLASMSNDELVAYWDKCIENAPCMVLVEDIDNVFNGRENITKHEDSLTFDCLLNCISGVQVSDGIFLAITTNDISKVDCAIACLEQDHNGISSRPGRIDRLIEMQDMDDDSKRVFARRMFQDTSMNKNQEFIENIVSASDGFTAAQFAELCRRKCVKLMYNSRAIKQEQIDKEIAIEKALNSDEGIEAIANAFEKSTSKNGNYLKSLLKLNKGNK